METLAFGELLGRTVAEIAQTITLTQAHVGKARMVTVERGGMTITFERAVLDVEREVTPESAVSALWAITSILRRGRNELGFAEIMGTSDRDTPEEREEKARVYMVTNQEKYAEWHRIGTLALQMFGDDWGNDRLLKQLAEQGGVS